MITVPLPCLRVYPSVLWFNDSPFEWEVLVSTAANSPSFALHSRFLLETRLIILCLIRRLIELSEGRFSLLHTFSRNRRSRSSQEKIPGCSRLYCSIFCSIRRVITLGLPTLAPPALIDPVFWYFDSSLLIQPWVIFSLRLMSQGRTPRRANSTISSRTSLGRGFPLM